MHADMTAVTIQSSNVVSNEARDNETLLEPVYEKKKERIF